MNMNTPARQEALATDAQLHAALDRLHAVAASDPRCPVWLWAALSVWLDRCALSAADRCRLEAVFAACVPRPSVEEVLAVLATEREGDSEVGAL